MYCCKSYNKIVTMKSKKSIKNGYKLFAFFKWHSIYSGYLSFILKWKFYAIFNFHQYWKHESFWFNTWLFFVDIELSNLFSILHLLFSSNSQIRWTKVYLSRHQIKNFLIKVNKCGRWTFKTITSESTAIFKRKMIVE